MESPYPDDSASTTGPTMQTPSETFVDPGLWDGNVHAVPWPGSVYMIIEKASGKAITLKNGSLSLRGTELDHDEYKHWLCVEAEGYFGFFNPKLGKYLGHDGKWDIQASAIKFKPWEYFTPRSHPDGGYQLLTPYYSTLREVAVNESGNSLIRRQHGTTLWEFVKVPKHERL